MGFHLICEVLWLKVRKILKMEKWENMMEKQSILKKKLKRHLYQNGKMQNMPVVAGFLLVKSKEMCSWNIKFILNSWTNLATYFFEMSDPDIESLDFLKFRVVLLLVQTLPLFPQFKLRGEQDFIGDIGQAEGGHDGCQQNQKFHCFSPKLNWSQKTRIEQIPIRPTKECFEESLTEKLSI